jgi:DinB superfamily
LAERTLVASVQEKVFEGIERVEHLVSLVPGDRMAWKPALPPNVTQANDLGHTLGHLVNCVAGFCAVFRAAFPEEFADLEKLREVALERRCDPEQAREGIRVLAGHVRRGFECCCDADLARTIPTVFVAGGESVLTLLLGNLEHLLNHKYQLFLYLKLTGVPVTSRDIYRFRG